MNGARAEELAANLATVRRGIDRACADSGRDPSEVTLVAVTKTWPASDVRRLVRLGVRDVGENRDQEAAAKARACRDLEVRWHFVGQLQTNKARSVAAYADVVHSVDRLRLVAALDRAVTEQGRRLLVLLQLSLDPRPGAGPGRGGAAPEQIDELAAAVAATESLDLRGVMGVAPLEAAAGPAFARLAEVSQSLRSTYPLAEWVSAGMTHDHVEAIRHGATHVRIGSALLGNRPPLR